MRIALFAAARLGASAAAAATLTPAATPRIVDAATIVDYSPAFGGQFFALGRSPVAEDPALAPFDFQIDGALGDPGFAPVLTVSHASGGALLSGVLTAYSVGADGALSLLFDVTADAQSLFGPQVLASLALGHGDDPHSAAFSVEAAATIAPADAPVPLPASGRLLVAGLALLQRARRS